MTSDYAKNRLHLPRSYCASLVAVLFIVSQLMAVLTNDVTSLWRVSLVLGLAYGGLFGLFPMLTFEWFGMRELYFVVPLCDTADLLSPLKLTSPRIGVSLPSHLFSAAISFQSHLVETLMHIHLPAPNAHRLRHSNQIYLEQMLLQNQRHNALRGKVVM
jgi:hypothetical protein